VHMLRVRVLKVERGQTRRPRPAGTCSELNLKAKTAVVTLAVGPWGGSIKVTFNA